MKERLMVVKVEVWKDPEPGLRCGFCLNSIAEEELFFTIGAIDKWICRKCINQVGSPVEEVSK